LSVGLKSSSHQSYSLPGEPRQALSAGSKFSSPWKPLTNWKAKERHCQQGPNPAHHRSHLQTGEPRTALSAGSKIQLTMEATHRLESETGIVSRVKIQLTTETTHFLESQGQVPSAGQNPSHHRSHSQTGEPRTGVISRVQIQLTTEATHTLKSQGQALSAGSKSSSPPKPLTPWRAEDRCCQQGPNPAHYQSCLPTGEARTGVVSTVQIQLTIETTHFLERQGQVLLAGSKSSSPPKLLTFWRAKDRHHQQGPNPAHH